MGRGAGSEAWNRVSMIAPVKCWVSWKRNMADFHKWKALVKFSKRVADFTFKRLRKRSS